MKTLKFKSHMRLAWIALLSILWLLLPQVSVAFAPNCQALFIRPEIQKVYPGILVELENGERKLGFAKVNFGPGHKDVFRELRTQFPNIKRVLWLGELEEETNSQGHDVLVRANEFSGDWYKYTRGMLETDIPYINDVFALRKYLKKNGLKNIEQIEFIKYVKGQPHFDARAESLRRTLNLESTTHDIRNILEPSRSTLMGLQKLGPTPKLNQLLHNLLKKYVPLLDILGDFFETDTDRMLSLAKVAIANGDQFTPEELTEFTNLNNMLISEFNKRVEATPEKFRIF